MAAAGARHLAEMRLAAKFPLVLPRMAKGYVRAWRGERRPLRGAEFCVTYRCQLDCDFCLTKPLIDRARREMETSQAVAAIDAIASLGAIFVNLTGGEALMREDIFEIASRAARRRDLLVTLASHGLSIDASVARELEKARVAIVLLSLDGPDAETHDASRGREGAFDKLMASVEALHGAGIPIFFTTILTRENAEDGSIFRTARLAKKLGGTLTVNWSYMVGANWSCRAPNVSDTERRAFGKLMRMPGVRWEGSNNFAGEGCPAGSEKIYVTPYGDVFPCAVLQGSFGNLLHEPLADIWRRMGGVPEFADNDKPCLAACDADFSGRFELLRRAPGADFAKAVATGPTS
ncbi:radical SAM protein [bacterium]|nr:radical SAM protein [bacterium]